MRKPKICVIGACNIDLISYVDRMPDWGETLHGHKFHIGYGGKGANQAVMAAKLGAEVFMISKLGRDVFGDDTLRNLESHAIDTSFTFQTDQSNSGVAPIMVDSSGRNAIVVVTGANDLLTTGEIDQASGTIASADILVCQWEIPIEANLQAMKIAKGAGTMVIFNPAPAREECPDEIFEYTDVFCPNESEAKLISKAEVDSNEGLKSAADHFHRRGVSRVIITLGHRGSYLSDQGKGKIVPTPKVKAYDTTGAGDCFIGTLAYYLAIENTLEQSVEKANQVAALSVQKSGTQSSFPDKAEILELD